MALKFSGLNHLAMATGDMDGTVRFWRDLVGMRLVAATGKPGFRRYMFGISPTELLIFFEWPGVEPVEEKGHGTPATGPFGFDHVSFGVETRDDLFTLKDKMNSAGIWVSEVIDHGFINSIYSYDPNGIAVEFSYRTDMEFGKNPVFVAGALSETAEEGPEPNPSAWPEVVSPTSKEQQKVYRGEFFLHEKTEINGIICQGAREAVRSSPGSDFLLSLQV